MTKYPKTPHLPWSSVSDPKDTILYTYKELVGEEIVITEKLDGENCIITKNDIILKDRDIKRDIDKKLLEIAYQIQKSISEYDTIVLESMFHSLSINYDKLERSVYGISYWKEDLCLSWENTTTFFNAIDVITPPILYNGSWNNKVIIDLNHRINNSDSMEGYVVRIKKEFKKKDFDKSIAKYVKPFFVQKRTPDFNGVVNN